MFLSSQLESDLYALCEAHSEFCVKKVSEVALTQKKQLVVKKVAKNDHPSGDGIPQIAKELFGPKTDRNFYEREPGEEG
jgi:hypothetical protein